MKFKKLRDSLIPYVILSAIVLGSISMIAYARGYRFDILNNSLEPTGLIAATSDPIGAQILINGKLTSATNNTLKVNPDWYDVKIVKEGYQPWEKRLRIQGEIVSRADAYLFPLNPSLSTITTYGVEKPVLSPDGAKLAFIIPENNNATGSSVLKNRAGVWILDMIERPLGLNRDARQIALNSYIDYSNANLTWSPDSKQVITAVSHPITEKISFYQLETSGINDSPLIITDLTELQDQWQQLENLEMEKKLGGLKRQTKELITKNMKILSFSANETKILYEASVSANLDQVIIPPLIGSNPTEEDRNITPETIYVYDIKEDKNFKIGTKNELGFIDEEIKGNENEIEIFEKILTTYIPPIPVQWLPTNRHLVYITENKIEAMDYDATNVKIIYSGPFWDGFVVPWSNTSRVLILTTLNPEVGTLSNLYAVNLR